jgi:hypothetical protein
MGTKRPRPLLRRTNTACRQETGASEHLFGNEEMIPLHQSNGCGGDDGLPVEWAGVVAPALQKQRSGWEDGRTKNGKSAQFRLPLGISGTLIQ